MTIKVGDKPLIKCAYLLPFLFLPTIGSGITNNWLGFLPEIGLDLIPFLYNVGLVLLQYSHRVGLDLKRKSMVP